MTSGSRLRVRRSAASSFLAAAASVLVLLSSCGHMGRLRYVPQTVAPLDADSAERHGKGAVSLRPMFSDTLIGLVPGSGDSTKRYLGRLRGGLTADTLEIILLGDNRPGNRTTRLAPEYFKLQRMFSPNPARILTGLITIPVILVKGLFPDLALIRDIPSRVRHFPTWGPERKVLAAMLAKVDSLRAQGKSVAAVINTGDLVYDGRYPATWERFLRINQPLYARVPYFAVAGNHERTDAEDGIANWRTATGLPVGGDRLYYCFDSADGWVRFIALDSNPMVDPSHLWTRELQIKYSDEEIRWMVARLKEHHGPAFVFMHHPPFSVGFHHDEWQADSVMQDRRERMVKAMKDAGIGVLASGHVHAYQRALFTWPDAVLVSIVTGGGGAPLYAQPPPAQSAQIYSRYHVAGSTVKTENVFTGVFNHFVHVRLWFGGGIVHTYSVDRRTAKTELVDNVHIDLSRYGVPKIDQRRMPIAAKVPSATGQQEESVKKAAPTKSDSVAASRRILGKPAPSQAPKIAKARRDSVAAARRDSVAARRKVSIQTPPTKPTPH
jgi:hypothetical protein